MERISFEKWAPLPENPRKLKYIGQRTAQEVFEELQCRLKNMGYLPDEYFIMDSDWEHGRLIPEDADIFCTTDYGPSEGIYIDVYLKWYDDDQEKSITKNFATGKTLQDSGSDMDRMFLIASAITKAFHGDMDIPSRYLALGKEKKTDAVVIHLNPDERRTIVDALVEKRNHLLEKTTQVEQLLRRITGSVTEYINEVGQQPLNISDYDMAVLAIQDGNLKEFQSVYPKVPADHLGELLVQAAGRSGTVGRKMTMCLLADDSDIPNELYLVACKKAVNTGDMERVLFLTKHMEEYVRDLDLSIYGEVISYAYENESTHIAKEIIKQCTSDQIAAANPYLLCQIAIQGDFHTVQALVEKGIDTNQYAKEIIELYVNKSDGWMVKHLLDRGMDFEKYLEWLKSQRQSGEQKNETIKALSEYWKSHTEQDDQELDDIAMG